MRRQHRRQVAAGDLAPPEILRGLEPQRAVVLDQLELVGQAGGEGGVGERALAEAVDGEDRRLVEGLQRQTQAGGELFLRVAGGGQMRQQLRDEGIGAGRAALQDLKRLHDALADAPRQLGGRRLGEGDHQQRLDRQFALEQQAQVEAADVPGLAGAGRGLDQADAVERAGEDVEFGGGGHGRGRLMAQIKLRAVDVPGFRHTHSVHGCFPSSRRVPGSASSSFICWMAVWLSSVSRSPCASP